MVDSLFGWLLEFISHLVGNNLESDGAFRILLLLALAVLFTVLTYNWKAILHQVPIARRLLGVNERIVGSFIQPIYNSELGLRYTIIYIEYVGRKNGYKIVGRSYDKEGSFFATFDSEYHKLRNENVLEYVWSGREQSAPIKLSGYTWCKFHLLESGAYLKGRGFSIDFAAETRTNSLLLEKVTVNPANESSVVVKYHRENEDRVKRELIKTSSDQVT